ADPHRRRATVENWPSGYPFLVVLAGGPLGAAPATLLARSQLSGVLAGRLALVAAVGGLLLGVEALDGRVGPLGGAPRAPGFAPARGGGPPGKSRGRPPPPPTPVARRCQASVRIPCRY